MMTLRELMITFPNEDACKRFLKDRRWPDGTVKCPRCGNEKVWLLKHKPWHWQCQKCSNSGYRFSVIAGTIFENTNYPLRTWFEVLWSMLNAKKGISAKQIQRQIGSSYPTAWYLCHRLRAAMKDVEFTKLMGIVEVDETGIGGKDKNRHWDKRQHVTGLSGKTTVIGAIARKGNVVCQMIENTDAATLNRFVRKAISDKVDLVATDEHHGYDYLQASGFRTKQSAIAQANMCAAKFIPIISRTFGACSSAGSSVLTITYPRSTFPCTSRSFNSALTTARTRIFSDRP